MYMRKKAFDPLSYILPHLANLGIYRAAKKSNLFRKAIDKILPKPTDKKPVKLLKEFISTYTLGPDARYIYNLHGNTSTPKRLVFLLGHGILTAASFHHWDSALAQYGTAFFGQHLLRELQYTFEKGMPILNKKTLREELQDYRKSLFYNTVSKIFRKVDPKDVMAWQEGAGAALLTSSYPKEKLKEVASKEKNFVKLEKFLAKLYGKLKKDNDKLKGRMV